MNPRVFTRDELVELIDAWQISTDQEIDPVALEAIFRNDENWREKLKHHSWTAEKPTKPGWYWYRDKEIRSQVVRVRFWIGYEEQDSEIDYLQMYRVDDFIDQVSELTGEWAGPLDLPFEVRNGKVS